MRGDRFKKRLPKFVGTIPDLDDTFYAEDKEFYRIDRKLKGFMYGLIASLMAGNEDVLDYLVRFEKDYGLEGVGSIDDRISAVLAKIGASRVTTEKALLDLCHSFGVEGEFYPDYGFYRFLLELRTRKDFNLKTLEKMVREIIPAHLELKTQVAVLTDVRFSAAAISGEHIVISQPALDDLVSEYPLYVRASNAGSYEYIEISGQEEFI